MQNGRINPPAPKSSVQITEMEDVGPILVPMPTIGRKRKSKAPNTVDLVRRSSRLANLKGGFKDGSSSAQNNHTKGFSANVVNPEAPAPPHLYVDVIQAIAMGPC